MFSSDSKEIDFKDADELLRNEILDFLASGTFFFHDTIIT
jgi:hypothetical protein